MNLTILIFCGVMFLLGILGAAVQMQDLEKRVTELEKKIK